MAHSAYGDLFVNTATGAYRFVPNDAAIEALKAPANASFTVTVSDGTFAASQAFSVSLAGANDAPTIVTAGTDATGAVTEDVGLGNLPAGLAHLYRGDGNANDSAGTAHGTLGFTGTFGIGLNGQAFSFNGAQSSLLTLPVDIGPSASPQITFGMFVYLRSDVGGPGWIMGHDNGGYDRSLILHDSRYGYGLATGAGAEYSSTLPAPNANLNAWHFIAVSLDQTTRTGTIFWDNQYQTISIDNGDGNPTATVGGLASFEGHTVNALVDDVFIFDRALSQAEIEQVRNGLSEPAAELTATGTIAFNDVDLIDTHTSVLAHDGNTLGGTLTMGAVSENAATGSGTVGWTYVVANSATQFLGAGQTATEMFTVTLDDGHGGTVDQLVTITIAGSDDEPANQFAFDDVSSDLVFDLVFEGQIFDLTATGNVLDNDDGNPLIMTVAGVDAGHQPGPLSGNVGLTVNGMFGWLTVEANGAWSYLLNGADPEYGYLASGTATDVFSYTASNGQGDFDTAFLTIPVWGPYYNGAPE